MQSDDRLANLFRRGVEPAFDELVERYRASLTAFAGAIVGSARAEDVVQDSLVKAHRAMAAEEVGEPRAWLYRIVRNTALNEIRDGKKHEHAELSGVEPTGLTPEREVEGRQEFEALVAALGELPEAQRQAIVDRELGGYTHDEIARELGISTGATKQLIFRARKGLRNAFGALIPVPLIIWLAQEVTGAFAAASSAGAVAGATASAGAAGGAGAGGVFAGLAGGGAAKVAAVAVVATGTVAAGVAVEQRVVNGAPDSRPAIEAVAAGSSAGIEFTEDGTPVLVPDRASSGKVDGSNRGADGRGGSSGATEGADEDRPGGPADAAGEEGFEEGKTPGRPTGEGPGRPSATSGRPGGGPGNQGGGGRPSGGGGPATNPGNSGGSGGGRPSGGGSGNSNGGGPATNPGNSGGSGGGRPSGGPSTPGGGKPSGPAYSRPGS